MEKIILSLLSCKRKLCYEYFDSVGVIMEFGSWIKMEICILSIMEFYIVLIGIVLIIENI